MGRPLFSARRFEALGLNDHRIVELPDGFRVEHPERQPITVRLTRSCLLLASDAGEIKQIGLRCSGRQLTYEVAGSLLPSPRRDQIRLIREAWALAPRVFDQRDRLLGKADATVLAVQEVVSNLCGCVTPTTQAEALYHDPYVVRDVLNYRAAAIALAYLESDLWEHYCRQQLGHLVEPSPEQCTEAMRSWRGLFSPDGKPYRSLNRTLMSLPKAIPPALLCHLRHVRLARPILDQLELATLLFHLAHQRPDGNIEVVASQRQILQQATAFQIRAAIADIATATRRELSPRRSRDVTFAINYLADYPEPYRGTIEGLVRRAIRWHQGAQARAQLERQMASLGGGNRRAARPPIPLPTTPGIHFLATVGAVIKEGRRMRNCIASYARAAVQGGCYLFHIDYEGEMASVEVTPKGEVRQAAGPGNCDNDAASWGRLQLGLWGRALRPPPIIRMVRAGGQAMPEAAHLRARPAHRRKRTRTVNANQLAFPFYAA